MHLLTKEQARRIAVRAQLLDGPRPSRLAALGIARAKGTAMPLDSVHVGDAAEPAVAEGDQSEWCVDRAALDDDFEGRMALLSAFDRLAYDRARTLELFDFEYTHEMYKPADKRRWGYFALPIPHHDRLVGSSTRSPTGRPAC